MPKFLPELPQLFYGDATVFGLETFSMLPAQMLDDAEIRAAFGSVQTFTHFRQWEATGLATLSDGNHVGRTGWSNACTKSRAGKRLWRTAIIGTRLAGRWKIGRASCRE